MQDVHIGFLPPEQNGISVYLYRLSKIEKNAQFIDWNQISESKKFRIWFFKQIFNFKKKNFIFHPPSISKRLSFFFLSLISVHDFSLVIHGFPLITQYNESNAFTKTLIRYMLNKCHFIQVVNPIHLKFLDHLKIKNKKIFLKNAFLPPPLEDENKIINSYEKELIEFIEGRKPLIVGNAANIRFVNNIDAYGLDLCIELTGLLKRHFPNIGFLFAIANDSFYPEYFQKMKKRISELKIENNFYFMTGQKELWPILKKADLMVRPSVSDGDAISVREALYFDCPVVASNVTTRPKETIKFNYPDLNDFYLKCENLLNSKVNYFD